MYRNVTITIRSRGIGARSKSEVDNIVNDFELAPGYTRNVKIYQHTLVIKDTKLIDNSNKVKNEESTVCNA